MSNKHPNKSDLDSLLDELSFEPQQQLHTAAPRHQAPMGLSQTIVAALPSEATEPDQKIGWWGFWSPRRALAAGFAGVMPLVLGVLLSYSTLATALYEDDATYPANDELFVLATLGDELDGDLLLLTAETP